MLGDDDLDAYSDAQRDRARAAADLRAMLPNMVRYLQDRADRVRADPTFARPRERK